MPASDAALLVNIIIPLEAKNAPPYTPAPPPQQYEPPTEYDFSLGSFFDL